MCWKPKMKMPAVSAQVQAPAPDPAIPAPKGVAFGDEDSSDSKKETSGIKGLTINPDTTQKDATKGTVALGSGSAGANFGSSSITKKMKTLTAKKGG